MTTQIDKIFENFLGELQKVAGNDALKYHSIFEEVYVLFLKERVSFPSDSFIDLQKDEIPF